MAWLNYLDVEGILPWAVVGCVVHELGHILVIYLCGGEVKLISLTAVGAEIPLRGSFSYLQEFLCGLAGPVMNFLFALFVGLFFSEGESGALVVGLSLALGCLNLLPVSQLDGGRALYCVLSVFFSLEWREKLMFFLDVSCSIFLLALGFWIFLEGGSVSLLLLGGWLFFSVLGVKDKPTDFL